MTLQEAEDRIEELEKALSFYAREDIYKHKVINDEYYDPQITDDNGDIARYTLKQQSICNVHIFNRNITTEEAYLLASRPPYEPFHKSDLKNLK